MAAQELPVRRYFLFVGGGLLALLLLLDAVLPAPATQSRASGPNFPLIRTHSELKRPSAVVIDTSQRMIAPVIAAQRSRRVSTDRHAGFEDSGKLCATCSIVE
jgi:hypothetical protein